MTCYTALITPFNKEGGLDEEGLRHNLASQNEMDGIVALGTTGETPTLTFEEKRRIIQISRESPLPLMVGCGAYSTHQTLENLKCAADLGADSSLVVTPYYNKPTQEGLFRHFLMIAHNSPLPIVLYNIPGRTAVNLKSETLEKLAQIPSIIGIKEASGDIAQISKAIEIKKWRPDFKVYAGDDALTLPVISLGGDGVISVASNLLPKQMKKLSLASKEENHTVALNLNLQLFPFFQACGFETNPIPIKAAMDLAGLAAGSPRLPLTPLDKTYLPLMKQIIQNLGLL